MNALTLDELSATATKQRLLQLESIFSFPTADVATFPQSHCEEFTQLIQHLPPGYKILLDGCETIILC